MISKILKITIVLVIAIVVFSIFSCAAITDKEAQIGSALEQLETIKKENADLENEIASLSSLKRINDEVAEKQFRLIGETLTVANENLFAMR